MLPLWVGAARTGRPYAARKGRPHAAFQNQLVARPSRRRRSFRDRIPPHGIHLSSFGTDNSSSSESSLDTFSEEWVTVLGYGSLLSETSSRLTCPELTKFRLGRVSGFRRVFAQPASTFFKYGIALKDTLEFACVSAEYCTDGAGFVVSVFDIPAKKMLDGVPQRLLEREASYEVIEVDFQDFSKDQGVLSKGLLSVRSTDEVYIERWGQDRFNEQFLKYGIETLWGWSETSGIRPCPVYLRHCYLAAKSMGELCLNSFLDECCLIDRTTTIRQYLDEYPEVLLMEAPPELGLRYNG